MYISNPRGKRRLPFGSMQTPRTRTPDIPSATNSPAGPTDIPANSTPAPSADKTQNIPAEPLGTGYLVVRVTTASGAIPVEGALVTVYEYNTGNGGDILSAQMTNSSGLTQKISLPAPPRSLSLAPDRGKTYSSYNIKVYKDGYNTQQYISAPIFDGITSVQNADLVPLPENGETDRNDPYNSGIFYEGQPSALERTSGTDAPENNS